MSDGLGKGIFIHHYLLCTIMVLIKQSKSHITISITNLVFRWDVQFRLPAHLKTNLGFYVLVTHCFLLSGGVSYTTITVSHSYLKSFSSIYGIYM